MARNEEKQLARLNRFYLQKDKEAQQKKNPPRPRLETLNTSAEIQKWLPSIKRDLNFYIKQSEVTCYPQSKIDQFSRKINGLKWEYRAFVRKLRELNPGLEVTPWTDRPYAGHKRKAEPESSDAASDLLDFTKEDYTTSNLEIYSPASTNIPSTNCESFPLCDKHVELKKAVSTDTTTDNSLIKDHDSSHIDEDSVHVFQFIPLSTPVLEKDSCYISMYGYNKPASVILNSNKQLEDAPLEFSNRNSTTERSSNKASQNEDKLDNGVSIQCVNVKLQKLNSVAGEPVDGSLIINFETDEQDKPLKFDSGKSRTCQNNGRYSINRVVDILDSVTHQHSVIVASDVKGSSSFLNQTHLPTNNTKAEHSELEKNCSEGSSLLVVPYSDSESETET
ncbi:uncharacterized protein LOC121374885 isoform X2 [Gigantopelta aegis]|nr:uncharacterized protein LOC121374885 isoform X2 [Gigantopelta aegis]